MEASQHVPVMKREVLCALQAETGGDYLDCTLGGGGHARALLEANHRNTVVAADRDEDALGRAGDRLQRDFPGRLELLHSRFSKLQDNLKGRTFDGLLADLGLSSDQLAGARGFSFNDAVPLDMRMEKSAEKSADWVVNRLPERDLFIVLKRGGVGAEARGVAKAITRARPLTNTADLASVIRAASPASRREHIDPATLAFQAIRMAVNDELEEIGALLDAAPVILRRPGRCVIISFHSLEEKAVVSRFRAWSGAEAAPASWGPETARRQGVLLTRKAQRPSLEEVSVNPRARSARLRVFEFKEE